MYRSSAGHYRCNEDLRSRGLLWRRRGDNDFNLVRAVVVVVVLVVGREEGILAVADLARAGTAVHTASGRRNVVNLGGVAVKLFGLVSDIAGIAGGTPEGEVGPSRVYGRPRRAAAGNVVVGAMRQGFVMMVVDRGGGGGG